MQELEVLKYQLDEGNYVHLVNAGGRIVKLVLGGITVIEGQQPYDSLGSGCYLMYPWVNRIRKPQPPYEPVFYDSNNLPIHGVVVNYPHSVKQVKQQGSITLILTSNSFPQLPQFTQQITLKPNEFNLKFQVIGGSPLPVCFGFHPYLQINSEPLKSLKIVTNIKTSLQLDGIMLPKYPFVREEIGMRSDGKYDHLFEDRNEGRTYFRLASQDRWVEIESSEMKYWQIYTPPDGLRIAVEPMTFCGNLYEIYDTSQFPPLPKQANFTIKVGQK